MRLILSLFLILSFSILKGQDCPTSSLRFETQTDVDSFIIKYPNCTELRSLSIGQSISNLEGFANIERINSSFYITFSDLPNLKGLDNLRFIRDFYLKANSNLENFSGLENLEEIEGRLEIHNNDKMASFQGLSNLKTIGSMDLYSNNFINFVGLEKIENFGDLEFNEGIVSFHGLEHLTTIGSIDLFSGRITDMSGLENLKRVERNLHLGSSLKSLKGIENLEFIGGVLRLYLTEIENLNELVSLRRIEGGLHIQRNSNFNDLIFIRNLEYLGGTLNFDSNPKLTSLSGLEVLSNIEGDLILRNNLFTNLQPLNNLTQITGTLEAFSNDRLINFEGLENLETIGGSLRLAWGEIENFKGLEKLTSIGGDLNIDVSNDPLESFEGLDNIRSIGRDFIIQSYSTSIKNLNDLNSLTHIGRNINIRDRNINDISGLNNVTSAVSSINIERTKLTTLFGLENLDLSNLRSLTLIDNTQLGVCELPNVCNYLANPNDYEISGNKSNCLDREQILQIGCSNQIGTLEFLAFYDENQNGIREQNEIILPNFAFELEQGNRQLITGVNDPSVIYLDFGNYSISAIDHPNWLSTNNTSQSFSLLPSNNIAVAAFGFYPQDFFSEIHVSIGSANIRCGQEVNFRTTITNLGTIPESGTLWIEIDNKVESFSFDEDIVDPDNADLIGKNYQDLPPNYSFTWEGTMKIPPVGNVQLGDIFTFHAFTKSEDLVSYSQRFSCSYDPNDKLVNPAREIEIKEPKDTLNFTLFEEPLTYTIRFQNTGNAVAYDIIIRDTLDEHLDASTFKFLESSHYETLSISIENNKYLIFDFKDINLPDSTSNFDDSNGHISFLIKPKAGLFDFDEITNTAHIYFDQNPPIITNTTENIMVSELPEISSTQDFDNQLNINIYPNPTDGKIYLQGENLLNAKVSVSDVTGRLVLVEKLNGTNEILLLKNVAGLLLLKIETEEGVAVKRIFKN